MASALIIESDTAFAQQLQSAFGARGVDVTLTADGNEGLSKAHELKPDVIVLCVELSGVSGYSICNKLKKDPELAAIPLVLTSSQATEETFEQHKKLKNRADAYLRKPYEPEQLLEVARDWVSLGAQADAADDVPVDIEDEDDDLDGLDVLLDDGGDVLAGDTPASQTPEAPNEVDQTLVMSSEQLRQMRENAHAEQAQAPATQAAAGKLDTAAAREPELSQEKTEPTTAPDTVLAQAASPAAPAQASSGPARQPAAQAPKGQSGDGTSAAEVKQLRQKVQQLEQTLEQKELEFNDRLLQESERGREAVELKKKVAQLERDVSKQRQAAEKAQKEAQKAAEQRQQAKSEASELADERDKLSEKLGQLVDKVKSLAAERDQLKSQLEQLEQAKGEVESQINNQAKVRQKAKKAVDIALQLIDETGLTHKTG